jgi:tellurite resistance protein TerC
MSTPILLWVVFGVVIGAMLVFDLFIYQHRSKPILLKEALRGSAMWIALALLFNLGVYFARGPRVGLEFLTGYLIELSLSMDNVFVFLLLLTYFAVPPLLRPIALFWGILCAIVMRLVFIFAGVALINRFHWVIYLFGAILIYSGVRMAMQKEAEVHPERNPVLKLLRRWFPFTDNYEEEHFFVRRDGRRYATPFLLVVIMLATTDLVFAVDSIPAVLAITRDPFVVFTSNVFAVLGLRALFFSIAGLMLIFHYLHYGLSAILVFVGAKMVLADIVHIPIGAALGVVGGILALCVAASLIWPRPVEPRPAPHDLEELSEELVEGGRAPEPPEAPRG